MGNLAGLADRLNHRVREIVHKKVMDHGKWVALSHAILYAWHAELDKLVASGRVPRRFADAYMRCLRIENTNKGRVTVAFDTTRVTGMDAMFARAVEYGVRPGGIDMKPWLLAGRPYRDIPIDQSNKVSGFQPTKQSGTIANVEQKLKMLKGRMPEGTVKKLRTGTQLTPTAHANMKASILAGTAERKTMPKYGHVTDPLAQAFKQTKPFVSETAKTPRIYGRKGSIFVIRRISDKSDPRSWHWMRRGMRGNHLAKKMRKIAKELALAILLG